MKGFKKIVSIIMILVITTGLLAACGKDEKSKNANGKKTFEEITKFEGKDITILLESKNQKVETTFSVRKNAFSVYIDAEDLFGIKGDLLKSVNGTIYFNLNKQLVNLIKNQEADDFNEINQQLEELGLSIEEGWIPVASLPDGFEFESYVYDINNIIISFFNDLIKISKEDGDEITTDFSNKAELEKIYKKYINNDIKTLLTKIEKDLKKIDYVAYVRSVFDANEDIIMKLVKEIDTSGMSSLATPDMIWQLAINSICNEVGISDEKEINDLIYDNINFNIESIINNELSSLPERIEDIVNDEKETFEASMKDGVATIVLDDVTKIKIKENNNEISKPDISSKAEKQNLVLIVGILAPAYIKYVEKSRKSADLSAINDIIHSAEILATDIDYEEAFNNTLEFCIQISKDSVDYYIMTNNSKDDNLTKEWQMDFGIKDYKLKSKDFNINDTSYIYGYVDSYGNVIWDYTGIAVEKMINYSESFSEIFE